MCHTCTCTCTNVQSIVSILYVQATHFFIFHLPQVSVFLSFFLSFFLSSQYYHVQSIVTGPLLSLYCMYMYNLLSLVHYCQYTVCTCTMYRNYNITCGGRTRAGFDSISKESSGTGFFSFSLSLLSV